MHESENRKRKTTRYSMRRPDLCPARDRETVGRMLRVRGYNTVNGNTHLDVNGVTT